ncbi:hypothetical protein [Caballeronia sp. SL2Y3]|uniref:hypothetical protein n=1 Tax=Caballeronia sp. SL2Y3 TaxID=2878151 RepID=UPI001FD61C0E|nr:hypothetical protein [Caballeronia sp. SL2Y3]
MMPHDGPARRQFVGMANQINTNPADDAGCDAWTHRGKAAIKPLARANNVKKVERIAKVSSG